MQRVEAAHAEDFAWDEPKRQRVLHTREIDFLDVAEALLRPHLEEPSDRDGEARTLAICKLATEIVAVIFTWRGDVCRIITARAARRYEREEFRKVFGG
jgi:uncharacterized DUF497 family protein